jgi:VWFA-related protein
MTADGPVGVRYMAHTAFRTASDILEKMASIPGRRKSFLYISEGYDFNPYTEARLKHEQDLYGTASNSSNQTGSTAQDQPQNGVDPTYTSPFQRSGNQFSEADLISDLAELIRMANRANVAMYTIDPRGLSAGPDINEDVSSTEFRDHQRTQITSLQALAENTGGFCICDTNDFDGRLQQIDAETSDYYVIGYNSSNLDPLRLRRYVKIEVKRSGLDLVYSKDYTLKKPSGKIAKTP